MKGPKYLLWTGLLLIFGVLLFAIWRKPKNEGPAGMEKKAAGGESGYVGARGWVLRLPPGYVGQSQFRDKAKTDELVYFARRGTDPTNFLDEGLYGELGIVRLEAAPSPFPPTPSGAARLARFVSDKLTARKEKFSLRNIQIATLPGVQANVQSPFPRVEAYVLGQNVLYFFYGGQEDEVWRDIVLSLRDAQSED